MAVALMVFFAAVAAAAAAIIRMRRLFLASNSLLCSLAHPRALLLQPHPGILF